MGVRKAGDQDVHVLSWFHGVESFAAGEGGERAKPVAEGAKPIVDIIEGKRNGEEGLFLIEGGVAAW